MFTNDTVIITGAGASWHYGYPTGERLIHDMIDAAKLLEAFYRSRGMQAAYNLPEYFSERFSDNTFRSGEDLLKDAADECRRFYAKVEVERPLIIDYFLGQNRSLVPIGKLLIAWVILDCERYNGSNRNRDPQVRSVTRDDWVSFVLHEITSGCQSSADLSRNKIKFITFNYDTSLERIIKNALESNELFLDVDIKDFMSNGRFTHVYGSIGVSNNPPEMSKFIKDPQKLGQIVLSVDIINAIHKISQGLEVIDPVNKKTNDRDIYNAKTAIVTARSLFVLGFGFDEVNSSLIGLNQVSVGVVSIKRVYVTNFQDQNIINGRIARVICGTSQNVLRSGQEVYTAEGKRLYVEKSIRSTYDALASDFDLQN